MSRKHRHRRHTNGHLRQVSPHELAEDIAESSFDPDPDRSAILLDGGAVVIPQGADLTAVISSLQAIQSERTSGFEVIDIDVTIPVPPWEGARALARAIKTKLGMFRQLPDRYGDRETLSIEVSQGVVEQVPWGVFDLPGLAGRVFTIADRFEQQSALLCRFKVERRFEPKIREIEHLTMSYATRECMHRGQAFTMIFRDEKHELLSMSKPKFFELVDEKPIFLPSVEESIDRNILVPLRFTKELEQDGFSLKRSALFVGAYGLGKTLVASYLAHEAMKHGWTFVYVKNANELPDALRFAVRYQPVMVFAEDIDRVAGIDRTDKVNELLNQLDGIDSKSTKLITILTSNHPERINEAMMRPGRVDLVLRVPPPDAATVIRMVRRFGGSKICPHTDLTELGEVLKDESPARIREVLRRSTLEVLRRTGNIKQLAIGTDLVNIAHEVVQERKVAATAVVGN